MADVRPRLEVTPRNPICDVIPRITPRVTPRVTPRSPEGTPRD
ncbi:hypothetical protein [Lentzea sp. NPDC051838]